MPERLYAVIRAFDVAALRGVVYDARMTGKLIPGWPGYSVYPEGYVVGPKGGVLRTALVGGYPRISLSCGVRRKAMFVHLLVADAFLPPKPSPKHQMRHLDGDRMNASASNLCWGTPGENAQDKHRHGTMARGARNGMSKLTEQQVAEARKRWANGGLRGGQCRGETCKSLAKEYGVSSSTMHQALSGKYWRHA